MAIRQFRYTLSLESSFEPAILWCMYSYIHLGQAHEAKEELKKFLMLDQVSAKYSPQVDAIYEHSKIDGVLRWLVNHGLKFYGRPYNQPYHRAVCYALLREPDAAFDCLEELYDLGSFRLLYFKSNPTFYTLKDDPRHQSLVRRIGLWRD